MGVKNVTGRPYWGLIADIAANLFYYTSETQLIRKIIAFKTTTRQHHSYLPSFHTRIDTFVIHKCNLQILLVLVNYVHYICKSVFTEFLWKKDSNFSLQWRASPPVSLPTSWEFSVPECLTFSPAETNPASSSYQRCWPPTPR